MKTEDSLGQSIRDKQTRIEEMMKEMKFQEESHSLQLQDMQHQLTAK
jgi:hypothetical protein